MSIWNILLYALHVLKRACAYGCSLKSQNLLIKKIKISSPICIAACYMLPCFDLCNTSVTF